MISRLRSTKLFFTFFVLITLSTSLFFACKKDKPDDNPQPQTEKKVSLESSPSVLPGQIVIAQANFSLEITENSTVNVGGQNIKVYASEDNKIMFLMPVLPAGNANIDYTNIGAVNKLNVTVQSYAPVTDPEAVFTKFSADVSTIKNNFQEHVNNPIVNLDPKYIEIIDYLQKTIEDNSKNLTEAEKTELAYFLQNNAPNTENFKLDTLETQFYLGKRESKTDPVKTLEYLSGSFFNSVVYGIASTTIGLKLTAIPSPTVIEKLIGTGSILFGGYHIANAISCAERIGLLGGVAEEITNFEKRAEELELINNASKTLSLKGSYRTLRLSDNTSNSTVIKSFFEQMEVFQKTYNNFVVAVNKILIFYPWKTIQFPMYQNPIKAQSKSKEAAFPGSRLSIANVSNSNVNIDFKTAENAVTITPSTALEEDQNVSFDLIYKAPEIGITLTKRIDAVVKAGLEIGQEYGGGIIFYLDETGKHGLVMTSTNVGSSKWSTGGDGSFDSTNVAIGTGRANTKKIIALTTTSAAKICDDLVRNGYDDWYLPSRDELGLVYTNLSQPKLVTFPSNYYHWSSSAGTSLAWYWELNIGGIGMVSKSESLGIRAIRSF